MDGLLQPRLALNVEPLWSENLIPAVALIPQMSKFYMQYKTGKQTVTVDYGYDIHSHCCPVNLGKSMA